MGNEVLLESEQARFDAYSDDLESRLTAWTYYRLSGNKIGNGDGSCLIGRLSGEMAEMTRQGNKGKGKGKKVFACLITGQGTRTTRDIGDEVETDRAVEALPYIIRRILKAEYLTIGVHETKAKSLSVSVRTYRDYLRIARYSLISYFIGCRIFK